MDEMDEKAVVRVDGDGNARVNGRPFQRLAGSVSEDGVRGGD